MKTKKKTGNRKTALTAYVVTKHPMEIRVAERHREWMEQTPDRFAYRCLPLVLGNQVGWELLCPVGFTAVWNGKAARSGIKIKFDSESSELVASHFGHGVLTFTLGYLFETPHKTNMWVKGPANAPKDGIAPLEGIVETDWAPFSFTMNWKFTRAKHKVRFEAGEPVCRIVPFPRHYLEEFVPTIRPIHSNPNLSRQYLDWTESRTSFIEDLSEEGSEAQKQKWQRTYMRGEDQSGRKVIGHQTKVQLRNFTREE